MYFENDERLPESRASIFKWGHRVIPEDNRHVMLGRLLPWFT